MKKKKILFVIIFCFLFLIGFETVGSSFVVENLIEITMGDEGLVFSEEI